MLPWGEELWASPAGSAAPCTGTRGWPWLRGGRLDACAAKHQPVLLLRGRAVAIGLATPSLHAGEVTGCPVP